MYVEDQDEDVEEEEEFHEVEEEKHKTSQESVGCSGDKATNSPIRNNKQSREQSHQNQAKETFELTQVGHQSDNKANKEESALVASELQADAKSENDGVQPSESCGPPEKDVVESSQPSLKPSTQEISEGVEKSSDIVVEVAGNVTNIETPEKSSTAKANDSSIDWANIMLNSNSVNSGDSVEENLSSDKARPVDGDTSRLDAAATADDTIDGIIRDTKQKLKITEEGDDSNVSDFATSEVGPAEKANTQTDQIRDSSGGDLVEEKPDHSEAPQEKVDSAENEGTENEGTEKVEEVEKKELDLDEDVKNPQYIPKKGVFYEHDDRSHDVEVKKLVSSNTKKDDDTVEVKDTGATKKTAGGEKQTENRRSNRRQRTDADRWNHDLFRNEKQKPKSKSELISAYGYDIRQERGSRNQTDNRGPRTNSTTNNDRPQGSQERQRSRQSKDVRAPRQNQATNQSRERKPRRQNLKSNRADGLQSSVNRRDGQLGGRTNRTDTKDLRETLNEKHAAQEAAALAAANVSSSTSVARDQGTPNSNRNTRNDSRGRRKTSRDRPSNDESRLPPANAVMPPITTWSSEDMMKAEAFGKKSPPAVAPAASTITSNATSMAQRDRAADYWQQGQQGKNIYPDRSRNPDDTRHQSQYNNRGRFQDRGDDSIRPAQFVPRNQYNNDRAANHQYEWYRSGNFSSHAKPNDYIKTQTFENSRLSQANVNRGNNNRDLREVIDRRVHNQQNFQNKIQHSPDHHMSQRGPVQGLYHHQYAQQQHYMHPQSQQLVQGQQHLLQHQQQHAMTHNQQHQPSQQPTQRSQQPSPPQAQTVANHTQQQAQQSSSQVQQPSRQPSAAQATQPHQGQQRQNLPLNNVVDNSQDSNRLNASNNTDIMNSRPIIKTDSYTGQSMPAHPAHSQPLSQHSQNHRSMGAPISQGPAAGSHMVSSHLGAGATQPQYYTPSSSSRDSTAAALTSAYHGYMPGGHSVMDPSRYHMTSQQLSDHGYITSPGQTNDVAGSVLHQQGLYTDTSAGGTMASSAYMGPTGSTLSPTSNIPVTGAGPQPLPPVSYIQHSQYPPPPYTNPYTQPQHNQAPPPAGHAYSPYWTYI